MVNLNSAIKTVPQKTFTPIGDMIAVSIIKGPDETEGGVVLPETAVANWTTPVAQVVAIGPDVKQVQVGNHVLCSPSLRCDKVRFKNREYLLVQEKQIAGIVDR